MEELKLDEEESSNSPELHTWSRLPEDVAMEVLARVPVPHLLGARTVCKKWISLISSAEFRKVCQLYFFKPYFPILVDSRAIMFGFDHETQKWQKFPPLNFFSSPWKSPLAAAEGLVCYKTNSNCNFVLCNPVSRTCTKLPQIVNPVGTRWDLGWSRMHMLVDRYTGYHRVITLGLGWEILQGMDVEPLPLQRIAIYESTTKAWRFSHAPRDWNLEFDHNMGLAVCGNTVYYGTSESDYIGDDCEYGVMAYGIQTDMWLDEFWVIPPDVCGDYPDVMQVVQCGGDIYIVQVISANNKQGCFTGSSVKILKLEARPDHSVTCLQLGNSPEVGKA